MSVRVHTDDYVDGSYGSIDFESMDEAWRQARLWAEDDAYEHGAAIKEREWGITVYEPETYYYITRYIIRRWI